MVDLSHLPDDQLITMLDQAEIDDDKDLLLAIGVELIVRWGLVKPTKKERKQP